MEEDDDDNGYTLRAGYQSGDIGRKEEAEAALDEIFTRNKYLKSSLFYEPSSFWNNYEGFGIAFFLFVIVIVLSFAHDDLCLSAIIILLPPLLIFIKLHHNTSVGCNRMKAACLFANLELQSFLKDVMDALNEEIEKENGSHYGGEDFKEFNDMMYDKSKYHQFEFPMDAKDYLFNLWVLWKNEDERRKRL